MQLIHIILVSIQTNFYLGFNCVYLCKSKSKKKLQCNNYHIFTANALLRTAVTKVPTLKQISLHSNITLYLYTGASVGNCVISLYIVRSLIMIQQSSRCRTFHSLHIKYTNIKILPSLEFIWLRVDVNTVLIQRFLLTQ